MEKDKQNSIPNKFLEEKILLQKLFGLIHGEREPIEGGIENMMSF